ncbi:hypothetical protein BVI1335_2020008 [Burkholderia vietnamiensis]|nr:hypothetical protein BVI1335_2020008 [Burkholderia vietnamiensis]
MNGRFGEGRRSATGRRGPSAGPGTVRRRRRSEVGQHATLGRGFAQTFERQLASGHSPVSSARTQIHPSPKLASVGPFLPCSQSPN